MHLRIKGLLWPIAVFATIGFSSIGFAQDLTEAKAICNDLSADNRAMAQAAGYDIDQLCRSLDKESSLDDKDREEITPAKPRRTASSRYEQYDRQMGEMGEMGEIDLRELEAERLQPFGYDLFANVPDTFASLANIPVSSDYLLGPGDGLEIFFYGKLNQSFSVEINRDGQVDFPELGPVVLAGLTFGEAKELLRSLVASKIIGTQINISMGALRSIQVFVLGEAYTPGAYMVSSLATITHALMSSGGVSDIASLRNIQLKRAGKVVSTLDVYELLLSGDTRGDVRLQSSDVIFIPPVGDLVSIDGEVLRPAIYELKGKENVQDLLKLAGGMSSKAFGQSAKIERINSDGFMTVVDLDLSKPSDRALALMAGDFLRIDAITDQKRDIVSLEGYVNHPGDFAWRSGMRASDLIGSVDQFPPDVDLDFGLIVREISGGFGIEVHKLDIRALLSDSDSAANKQLLSRDKLLVFSAFQAREAILAPVITKLERQARLGGSAKVVAARGEVRFPGDYPLVDGMTMADLISVAGGLTEGAYKYSSEVSRTDFTDPERASTVSISVALGENAGANFKLRPLDNALFKTVPEYRDQSIVSLKGEVKFPGDYPFARGETLTSVINRAGGFTELAYSAGAVFTREALKTREQQEMQRLEEKLTEEMKAEQLKTANGDIKLDPEADRLRQEALDELGAAEAVGRLVIPLQNMIDGIADDLVLEDGDALIIPGYRQEVSIVGEVQQPTSYLYSRGLAVQDYIDLSGGVLKSADKKGVYLVKASGQVIMPKRALFRFGSKNAVVEPGDTIVVPLDTDDKKLSGISLVTEVSQIIYQLSLGAAAINSLNQ